MKPTTRQWLLIAQDDLATARAMLKAGRYLWTGFVAQQAAEKALKAVLQEGGTEAPPRIHDLVELGGRAGMEDPLLLERLQVLKTYYVATRYPEERERIQQSTSRRRASDLLHTARDTLKWAQMRLTSGPSSTHTPNA